VKGYAYPPASPTAGDAWPKWSGGEAVAPGTFETTWQIVVLLPGNDDAARDTWINAHLGLLCDALAADVWVVSVEPGTHNDSPALMLNSRE
jgi:hypothetical protein